MASPTLLLGGPVHACCDSTALALTNHDKGEKGKSRCHG